MCSNDTDGYEMLLLLQKHQMNWLTCTNNSINNEQVLALSFVLTYVVPRTIVWFGSKSVSKQTLVQVGRKFSVSDYEERRLPTSLTLGAGH